ncbi:helix-turn-helix domain-containing protein [Enterococcus mundtii]|uniref:helix-turn-helix domain-containing protein n=1 Tax=Enterococcus mundtii TaxID=53346 RepID=UPI000BB532C3|nr:helix-turn-helix domain-containing protein [Enterococcus mundtii]PJK26068.1 Fis family transcriptional regulator [Enterococcus mundtii]
MNTEKLLGLYPNAQKKNSPSSDDRILSLVVEDYFLWIDKSSLSVQEEKLLKALFQKTNTLDSHPWYQYLFEEKVYVCEENCRIIQLHFEKRSDFLQKEWRETISGLFPEALDFFLYTETDALIIERKHANYLSTADLKGIFLSLDVDFDMTTQAFVGSFHSAGQNLTAMFNEERKIFLNKRTHIQVADQTTSIQEIALYYYTKELVTSSQLTNEYQEIIRSFKMEDIIIELWKNFGNISSAAKQLFMHRNTLQYRIEKFDEQTGFNLKKADDLLFCYLLLLHI